MKQPIDILFKRIFKNTSNIRKNKRVIVKFDNKVGMLYFGSVDQRHDDHQVVRGFTVSSTHKDSHYSVGSVNSYDVTIVNRSDIIIQPDKRTSDYNWLIMSFRLKTQHSLPHIFIKSKQHNDKPYEVLFDIFPIMQEVKLGVLEEYSEDFVSRFSVYSQPAKAVESERLIPAATARVLAAHLWPLSVEIHDGFLYLYSDSDKVDSHLLDNMLKDGLWLAAFLDNRSEVI